MTSHIAAGILLLATACCSMSCLAVLGVLLSSVSLSVSSEDDAGEFAPSSSKWSSNMGDNGYKNDVSTTTESISQEPNILSLEERQDDLTPCGAGAKDRRHLHGQETFKTSSSRRDHYLTPPQKEKERRSPTRLSQWRVSSHKRFSEDKKSPYAKISMFLRTSAWISTALLLFCYLRAIQVICSQTTNTNTLMTATPHTGVTSRLLSEVQHPPDFCTVVRANIPSYRGIHFPSDRPRSHDDRLPASSLDNTNRHPSSLPSRSPSYGDTSPPDSRYNPHLPGHQEEDLSPPPAYDDRLPLPPSYEEVAFSPARDYSSLFSHHGATGPSLQHLPNPGPGDELPPDYSEVPPPYTDPYPPPPYEELPSSSLFVSTSPLVYEEVHPSHRRINLRGLYAGLVALAFLFVASAVVYSLLLVTYALRRKAMTNSPPYP
ncbi:hypothetical protein CSUI_004532 [Cystoisospora suis]|uniref:Transmembrane protein n=1 Tax=Cystoisospora suis TaxID=483139 RepID=A0A2C6L169_9APIC|nr:hypothetical protein CSUI_004532 [Cystoisospora suis]